MPTISELTALFGELPELPPPVPRKRMSFAQQKEAAASTSKPTNNPVPSSLLVQSRPFFKKNPLPWIWPWSRSETEAKAQARPTNPFPSLKTGKKMVIVAAVDAGTISFFRFGQGVFTEWPMA